ncbi:MAG: radical SAM protein [Candidatus Omnitrophica bacterium]|nr:radical SAM protein [Candidatus Omnitrophota bacterium]MBU1924642.1 radical SAM protein [Candidatus Omnitrophota bacterium]
MINFFKKKYLLLKFLSSILSRKNLVLFLWNYYQRLILRKKIPANVFLGVTFHCQFQCAYCGLGTHPIEQQGLTDKQWEQVIDRLIALKISRIHFTGGEPLLKKGIEDLVEYVYLKGGISFLETNGWDLSIERIAELKNKHLGCVCVSLNGASAGTHDVISGKKGSFDKVVAAIQGCRKYKMPVIINTVLRKGLIASKEFMDLLALASKLKVSAIKLIAPRAAGRWIHKQEVMLDKKEKKYNKKAIASIGLPFFGDGFYEETCRITAPRFIFISPGGDLYACPYIPYSFGNVLCDDILTIFKRISTHAMFQVKTGCKLKNQEFREKYIDCIKKEDKLPIKLY